jgi:hypothetical protein
VEGIHSAKGGSRDGSLSPKGNIQAVEAGFKESTFANSIDANNLEEALVEAIWESFVWESVKVHKINTILNNHMEDVNFREDKPQEENAGE